MASTYGYTTVIEVEALAGTDYSAVSAEYTDTVIEANITITEQEINTKCNTTFTAPLPDAINAAAKEVTRRRMYNRMWDDGLIDRENNRSKKLVLWDAETIGMIQTYIEKGLAVDVDLISMYPGETNYGAGYYPY